MPILTTEYNNYKAVNNSALSYLKKTPAGYYEYLAGNTKQTTPMRIGIALHEGILEPEKFSNNYEIKLEYKGEGIKARMAEQTERCKKEGKNLVSENEFQMLKGIAKTLHNDSFVISLLENAQVELPLSWDYAGVHCKGRLDGIVQDKAIFDFKFVADADPYTFTRKAKFYGYHRQAFWYKTGALQNGLITENCPYYIIAVEKEVPYQYSIIEVSEGMIREGKTEADYLLKHLEKIQNENLRTAFYGHHAWESEQYVAESFEDFDLGNL
jgi:PDDEXK-like domain of unknown function (DUF3799)